MHHMCTNYCLLKTTVNREQSAPSDTELLHEECHITVGPFGPTDIYSMFHFPNSKICKEFNIHYRSQCPNSRSTLHPIQRNSMHTIPQKRTDDRTKRSHYLHTSPELTQTISSFKGEDSGLAI